MAMGEINTAADLRRVMEKISSNVINRMRPDFRIGRVWSWDTNTQIAKVLFPGNHNLVPVKFALDKVPRNGIIDLVDPEILAAMPTVDTTINTTGLPIAAGPDEIDIDTSQAGSIIVGPESSALSDDSSSTYVRVDRDGNEVTAGGVGHIDGVYFSTDDVSRWGFTAETGGPTTGAFWQDATFFYSGSEPDHPVQLFGRTPGHSPGVIALNSDGSGTEVFGGNDTFDNYYRNQDGSGQPHLEIFDQFDVPYEFPNITAIWIESGSEDTPGTTADTDKITLRFTTPKGFAGGHTIDEIPNLIRVQLGDDGFSPGETLMRINIFTDHVDPTLFATWTVSLPDHDQVYNERFHINALTTLGDNYWWAFENHSSVDWETDGTAQEDPFPRITTALAAGDLVVEIERIQNDTSRPWTSGFVRVEEFVLNVLGPDQTITTTAPQVDYAAMAGNLIGDVVRVAGKPNDWFVLDYVSGSPGKITTPSSGTGSADPDVENDAGIDTLAEQVNFTWNETVVDTPGDPQIISLDKFPLAESEHVYWGGVQLPNTSWSLDGYDIVLPDPQFRYKFGRKLTCRYAWIESQQGPGPAPGDTDETPIEPPPDLEPYTVEVRCTSGTFQWWSGSTTVTETDLRPSTATPVIMNLIASSTSDDQQSAIFYPSEYNNEPIGSYSYEEPLEGYVLTKREPLIRVSVTGGVQDVISVDTSGWGYHPQATVSPFIELVDSYMVQMGDIPTSDPLDAIVGPPVPYQFYSKPVKLTKWWIPEISPPPWTTDDRVFYITWYGYRLTFEGA